MAPPCERFEAAIAARGLRFIPAGYLRRMASETFDAVVIGAGPNGLVAANVLVDAGWDVLLVEANDIIGGAVRTAEVTAPGFHNDLFSAFYPLAAASPVIRDLDLPDHGLEWVHAPTVLAHLLPDGSEALIERDPVDTAANLDSFAAGDGDRWLELFAQWTQVRDGLLDALFTPFPPIRAGLRLLQALGPPDTVDFIRQALLPVRRLADERFAGAGAAALLAGNAMHADIPPDAAGSGALGWMMCMLAQDVGFPVPRGGAQQLSNALGSRFTAAGGTLRTRRRVASITLHDGRATGVRFADGRTVRARRAVLADVPAPTLFRDMVGSELLPPRLARSLERFQWDHSTLKLNWALSHPVPWKTDGAKSAGTVHLGADAAGLVDFAADLSVGRLPREPFVLLGQMTTADPTRSPAGSESAWAYTHLPRDLANDHLAVADLSRSIRELIEAHAPGFRDSVLAEDVQSPSDLESADSNLVGGAINAGTAALHQQLIFRPTPGLGRPETPFEGLYLAGASAHPGGGVHGACGWNAARAALSHHGPVKRALARSAWSRILDQAPPAG